MLVLTQKEGEVLQIGEDVRIHIKRVKGNWVRLAIDAPREVRISRHAAEGPSPLSPKPSPLPPSVAGGDSPPDESGG